jgi:negative regulator of flagellin synthesis FlgM
MQPAEATRPTEAWYGVDEVEISQEAAFVSQTHDLPDIRADRVAEIRAQVADGVYETEAKLDIALGRFLDEVAG